ncbi:hypothetical protein BH23GEM6_BH23GEM6_21990 [soil metagenome]
MLNTTILYTALALLGGPAEPLATPADSVATRSVVIWTPESYSTMRFLYERITSAPDGVEFAACLRAHRSGNSWIVTEVVIPEQSGNTASSVEAVDCSRYEGIAHSHPLADERRHCYPSAADRAAFASSPNHFFVIWCDREAFTFRTRDLGIGGKDDVSPDRDLSTSAEPHLWRSAVDRRRP